MEERALLAKTKARTVSSKSLRNILTQVRHARNGNKWEDLSYHYQYNDQQNEEGLLRNRLYHINDAMGVVDPEASDLDDQGVFDGTAQTINGANNYVYDEEGRLLKDVNEEIEQIVWRVDGKVKSIERPANSGKKNVSFDYDAMGNRIAKHVYDDDWNMERSTYYILDAQGNTISTYDHEVDDQSVLYNLKERHIYGSAALGILMDSLDMYTASAGGNVVNELGFRYYQLSEHRGNVLAVINDIKTPLSISGTTVDAYQANLINIADYSPFGVELDGRTETGDFYRRSFQGQEKDDEVKGKGNSINYKYRMHDPRVGRFFAVDPLAPKYPELTPYQFSSNNVIWYKEIEGLEGAPPGWAEENGGTRPEEGTFYASTKTGPFNAPNGMMLSGTENDGVFSDTKLASIGWVYADKESNTWLAIAFETKSGTKYMWDNDKEWYVDSKGNEFDDGLSYDITNMVGGTVTPVAQAFIDKHEKNDAFYSFKKAWNAHGGSLASFMWDGFKQSVSDATSGGHKGFITLGSMYTGFLGSGGAFYGSGGFSMMNRTAATAYLRYTGKLDNFASVDGFSFGIGLQQRYIYHNSMGGAMNSRWFTSTRYTSSGSAFNGLGLDYFGSRNFAQNMYGFRNFGFSVKGTAAPQGLSFGGGTQYFRTGLSFGTNYTPLGF